MMPEPWWREHPAYADLCDLFHRESAHPNQLAFMVLAGLRQRGWDILPATGALPDTGNQATQERPL